MHNKCLYIPKEINTEYFLLWKRDEVIFLILPWLLAFVIGGILGIMLSLILTIIAAQILKQVGFDKPNGYMMHWLKFNVPKQFLLTLFSKNNDLGGKESMFFRSETFPPTHIRYIAG